MEVGPYAAYILWLCGSVFYHLPSLEALGFDIKADLSIAIVAFASAATVGDVMVQHIPWWFQVVVQGGDNAQVGAGSARDDTR